MPKRAAHRADLTIPLDRFRWLPAAAAAVCSPVFDLVVETPLGAWRGQVEGHTPPKVSLDWDDAAELDAVDRLRPGARSLRVGWLFVAGTEADGEGGRQRRVFVPLVTRPVRIVRTLLGRGTLVPAGDVEVSELIDDRDIRHRLETDIAVGGGIFDPIDDPTIPASLLARLPRLQRFATEAAGLAVSGLVPVTAGAAERADAEDLVVVAGVGLYAAHETAPVSRASLPRCMGGPFGDRHGVPPPLLPRCRGRR